MFLINQPINTCLGSQTRTDGGAEIKSRAGVKGGLHGKLTNSAQQLAGAEGEALSAPIDTVLLYLQHFVNNAFLHALFSNILFLKQSLFFKQRVKQNARSTA